MDKIISLRCILSQLRINNKHDSMTRDICNLIKSIYNENNDNNFDEILNHI